ncbi:Signal transducer regulating beta-lactamase production, contains metallopeptidase domain [Cyclobacterium lianum]|uniref:Signal transducer regulating beta-lactamase production, contains metallopeptidase domain n=1 Tax=Cyclobacterium lianum TaxID=388280 RepID=A0A1M7I5C5_9BACT|nr:M56 family metallopeptidase [Cyclobacterium lianum]SHM35992.1 Signal transducer regulating beta-lactamase production, contains metallopeptidase domain [Cyclobacterium lianum]
MNLTLPLSDIPELLGWALLHSLWQFLLLAGVYALILRIPIFRIPRYRYLAGFFSLILMFLCFLSTVCYEYLQLAAAPAMPSATSTYLAMPSGPAGYQQGLTAMAVDFFRKVLPYLVNVWFIGVVFYMLRLLGNFVSLQQIRRRSSADLSGWIFDCTKTCMQQMQIRLPVCIRKSEEIEVPMVFGILKPMVLIPAGLVFNMPSAQLEAIIAHELAHVRRHDFAFNLFQSFLEMIFFYHPAFWWINETIRESREQATDDLAIACGAKGADLAHALAHIVNMTSTPTPQLAMAASKSGFPTLHRIQRMMGMKPNRINNTPLITKTMMITSLLSCVLLLGTAQQEDLPREDWLETRLRYATVYAIDQDSPLSLDLDIDTNKTNSASSTRILSMDIAVEMDSAGERVEANVRLDSVPDMPSWTIPAPPVFPGLSAAPVFPAMPPAPVFPDAHPFIADTFMDGFGDSIRIYASKIVQFHRDTTPDGMAQKEIFQQKMKDFQQKMADAQKLFEAKMKDWEAEFKPKMEEFEAKMEAWRKENEPRMEEFEARMEAWRKANEPRMEEFEARMKEWRKEQEAKIEVIEEKIREREKTIEKRKEEAEQNR